MQTFKEILTESAKLYGNKTAFLFKDRRYTFREVNERVNSVIDALFHMGVKKGDHVGILAYNCRNILRHLRSQRPDWFASRSISDQ
jgi:acyl-CoA synthetase (AMP-forming)/AMP-acid ligase II